MWSRRVGSRVFTLPGTYHFQSHSSITDAAARVEAAAQVINVSRAVYVLYDGRDNAEMAFSLAVEQGVVEFLS